jgi:hypothetical protein
MSLPIRPGIIGTRWCADLMPLLYPQSPAQPKRGSIYGPNGDRTAEMTTNRIYRVFSESHLDQVLYGIRMRPAKRIPYCVFRLA